MFAIDYAVWFRTLLPGLERLGAPIPLGGTSNHFRIAALIEAGAWDPFNVTEDADLGLRLARLGHRVGILDSTTYEEAPARIGPWLPWMEMGWNVVNVEYRLGRVSPAPAALAIASSADGGSPVSV